MGQRILNFVVFVATFLEIVLFFLFTNFVLVKAESSNNLPNIDVFYPDNFSYIYCNISDSTNLFSRKIIIGPEDKIEKIKRIEDNERRYFVITLKDVSSSLEKVWLFDIGLDGVFSEDDSARLIILLQNSWVFGPIIDVSKITRDLPTGGEELFWMETINPMQKVEIKSCELPRCFQIKFIAQILPRTGYFPVSFEEFNLLPQSYNLHFVISRLQTSYNYLVFCSLVSTDLNWCGNNPDAYTIIQTLGEITDIKGVKNEGIAFNTYNGSKFLNVNTEQVVSLPNFSRINSITWAKITGVNNYAYVIEEQNSTQYYLARLDTISGATSFMENVYTGIYTDNIFLEIGIREVLFFFEKFENNNGKIYRKNLRNNEIIKVLDHTSLISNGLIITENGKVYFHNSIDGKLYSYDCT